MSVKRDTPPTFEQAVAAPPAYTDRLAWKDEFRHHLQTGDVADGLTDFLNEDAARRAALEELPEAQIDSLRARALPVAGRPGVSR